MSSAASTVVSASQDNQDYIQFCDYLEQSSGITLGLNKAYLVKNRLSAILQRNGVANLREALHKLQHGNEQQLKLEIIDAMTTNETSWFRDQYPFDYLKDSLLPDLKNRQVTMPRIWSAACSYGHEAYSISIIIEEFLQKNPGAFPAGIQIVATDISSRVVESAAKAEFDRLAIARGLSDERKNKFFTPLAEGAYRLKENITKRVRFQRANLLESYALLGKFDIIFCRNVLIYFSNINKSQIMDKFAQSLNQNGTLILGASETVTNYSNAFEMVKCPRGIVYRHV